MSLIKIISNNIELDFVKESLSIKIENNSLSRDFKVSHSIYPFLVVENKNTKEALGTRDLASVKKNKIVEVIVLEGGNKYYGELQILSCLNGFRKCNLKYSSIILSIMNKKIADFMPIVSVIPGEENPIPYNEESDSVIEGTEHWQTYPVPFLNHNFPEAKWQFPTMSWINKFGIGLEPSDEWFLYKNKINEYDDKGLILNSWERNNQEIVIKNKNVVSPQIFLLSPLYYALKTIGFKAVGSVMENNFFRKLLFQSSKDNLTVAGYFKQVFPPLNYSPGGTFWNTNFRFNVFTPGTYYIKYRFEETTFAGNEYGRVFNIWYAGGIIFAYRYSSNSPSKIFEGVVEFNVTGNETVHELSFSYSTQENLMPVYSLSLSNNEGKYYQFHPTIQLGRYLPDWTFATYLNEIQNLFNLEINTDDFTKKLSIDFNEETIANGKPYIINKSLAMTSYDQTPYNAFILRYENDEDVGLWITTQSVEEYALQTSNFSEKLSSKFKYVPNTFSANLSEGLDSKNGIGLMIYDPMNKPYTSGDYLGQTLKISGAKGIYQSFWKIFLKFLLNSSAVELSGPFTETEKNKIVKLKRIFIDNQEYIISSVQCSETQQDNFEIKFLLQSITF